MAQRLWNLIAGGLTPFSLCAPAVSLSNSGTCGNAGAFPRWERLCAVPDAGRWSLSGSHY